LDEPSNVFQAVILHLVVNKQLIRLIGLLEIADRHELPGIICCKCRALESLAKDLVAHPDALRVVRRGEELTLRLQKWSEYQSERVPC